MTKARDLANIISGGFTADDIPNLDTSKVTTGTILDARLPSTALNSNVDLTTLSASNLTSGTVATARLGTGTADATTFLRGDNTFNAPPLGGITNAQQWRISAAHSNMDNGDHVTHNWEVVDSYGYGGIGSAMSQSSGIFTFPSTGVWLVQFTYNGSDGTSQLYVGGQITSTTDNSNYNVASQGNHNITNANQYFTGTINFMFDVTNTTTHKIRFAVHCQNNGIALTGNTNRTDTGAVFTRLGDT